MHTEERKVYTQDFMETWVASVREVWEKHWQKREHRYKDFYAFLAERLLTDFSLREPLRRSIIERDAEDI